ncbi:MAG: hypothetical protein PHI29_12225 [Gallionella sp.]|nr:hypothetical protein [Gallionella sp.]
MVKSIIAVLIILAAGGGWFYMDYLNKQEQAAAAEMRKEVEHSRALAAAAEKARVEEAKAAFNAQLATDLAACKVAAEQASTDYITANQKPVPRKPGLFTIPAEVAEASAKLLADSIALCQSTYDSRLASGI